MSPESELVKRFTLFVDTSRSPGRPCFDRPRAVERLLVSVVDIVFDDHMKKYIDLKGWELSGYTSMKVEERTKLVVIVLLLSVATSVTFYYHIVLQEGGIFTQFFYLPLTLGAIWYRRYALLLVAYLAALLYITDLYMGRMDLLADDVLRTAFFLMVVIAVSYLSERLSRIQEKLEVSNASLETEVEGGPGS